MEFVQFVQFTTLQNWTRCVLRYLCGQWVEWPKITAIYHFAHGHIHCVAFHLYISSARTTITTQHTWCVCAKFYSISRFAHTTSGGWDAQQYVNKFQFIGHILDVLRTPELLVLFVRNATVASPSYRCRSQDLSVWGWWNVTFVTAKLVWRKLFFISCSIVPQRSVNMRIKFHILALAIVIIINIVIFRLSYELWALSALRSCSVSLKLATCKQYKCLFIYLNCRKCVVSARERACVCVRVWVRLPSVFIFQI